MDKGKDGGMDKGKNRGMDGRMNIDRGMNG